MSLTVRELIQYLSENADMDDLVGIVDPRKTEGDLVNGVVVVEMLDYTEEQQIVAFSGFDGPLKEGDEVFTYDDEESGTDS